MNSRERVLKAINYKKPDKIPVDFGSHRSSGIMAMAYARLKEELGIDTGNIYVYDMIQQVHNIMANVPPKDIVRLFDTINRIR